MRDLTINQFKDNTGDIWTLGITVGTYMKIKEEVGVDITNLMGDQSWLQKFAVNDDLASVITIVVLVLDKQLKAKDVSVEEFIDRLGADECDTMLEALLGGVVNFTPAHKREPVLKAVKMIQTQAMNLTEEAMKDFEKLETVMKNGSAEEVNSHLKQLEISSSKPQES
jgi:hypothetical protein